MVDAVNNADLYKSLGFSPVEEQDKGQGELGLEQFLAIMTTQLKNQDPLEPLDNGDFLGQMAQFGTVTGIENLNKSFSSFSDSITNGQALQAGSLVGRSVLAPVNTGYLDAGSAIRGRVDLDSSASNVELMVTDQYGQLVRTMNMGSHPSGPLEFTWDGIKDDGEYAVPGNYTIAVTAIRGFKNEALQTQLYNRVDSVTMGTGASGLTLNLAGSGSLPFSQVTAIQ